MALCFFYHFADPDQRILIFFEKEGEAGQNKRELILNYGLRHMPHDFMERLSAFLFLFICQKKNALQKLSRCLHFHAMISGLFPFA